MVGWQDDKRLWHAIQYDKVLCLPSHTSSLQVSSSESAWHSFQKPKLKLEYDIQLDLVLIISGRRRYGFISSSYQCPIFWALSVLSESFVRSHYKKRSYGIINLSLTFSHYRKTRSLCPASHSWHQDDLVWESGWDLFDHSFLRQRLSSLSSFIVRLQQCLNFFTYNFPLLDQLKSMQ